MPPLRLTDRTKRCLNLGSYNYLGFGGVNKYPNASKILEEALTKMPIVTASPSAELGHLPIHRELEEELAEFLGKEDSMVIGMGFATNSTVLPALVSKGDLIISDKLNHTSIVQGARESGAKIKPFIHNDVADLERVLQEAVLGPVKYGKILLVIEGIYSMEGDLCNLQEIVPLAKRYGAYIYLDEAHSIGAIGPSGRGVTDELGVSRDDIDIMMGTFSKSFGASGGYIAGPKHVVDYVRRFSAGATDAASMPPACAVQILQALRMISGKDGTTIGKQKLDAIRDNSIFFRRRLEEMGFEVLGQAPSPVIPVMLYTPTAIADFSRLAFKRGLAVVTVGAPAVPLMYGRIRFCISAAHKHEDLVNALNIIDEIGDELRLKFRSVHKPNQMCPGTLDSTEHKRKSDFKLRASKVAKRRAEALAARKKIVWKPLVSKEHKVQPYGWTDRKIDLSENTKVVVSSWDYLGLASDASIRSACVRTLESKGLGSCGPRGFYGTYPEHLKAERDIAAFFGTEQGILYPFGACTVSSVIACMANRDDVLIVDEGVGRNVLTGVSLTRAKVYFYKHLDMDDCERVLKKLDASDWENLGGMFGPSPKRKFLISEAIFGSNGNLAPVDVLAKLRLKYRCRLILDESHSFGTLGATGRGATEHFNLSPTAVDVICGSLEGAGASCCGFATGPTGVVSYQRLLGSGYCFSASAPPYLATSVSAAIATLRKTGAARLRSLKRATQRLRSGIAEIPGLRVRGAEVSPMMCVEVDEPLDMEEAAARLQNISRIAQTRGVGICCFNNRPKIGLRPSRDVNAAPALRVCASTTHTEQDVDYVLGVLREAALRTLGPRKVKDSCAIPDAKRRSVQMKRQQPTVDIVEEPPLTKQQIVEEDGGVRMPFLVAIWSILSLYRRFLKHESKVTGRFIDGWLHLFQLDRNSTSPAVRSFYSLARCVGSHSTYAAALPIAFWAFDGHAHAAIPFIFYSNLCAVGCMLKCAMTEGTTSRSWPSITSMSAVSLPFFLMRYHFGEKWLWNNLTIQSLLLVAAAIVWVVSIALSRMEVGDAPSNVVGGLVAGAVAIHVMLLWTPGILAWLQGASAWTLCPPIILAIATLLFCPLPKVGFEHALKFYSHASKHSVRVIGFMVGAALFPSSIELAPPTPVAVVERVVLGTILLVVLQLAAAVLVRKMLATSLTFICSKLAFMRKGACRTYDVLEPVMQAGAHGFLVGLVPAALRMVL